MEHLLEVQRLNTRFATPDGEVCAVNEVSFALTPGESLGVVGESGSGKTQLFLSLLGLLAKNGRVSGSAKFRGQELVGLPRRELNRLRGAKIAMIFQDPMTSLNPYLKISRQMTEVLIEHKGLDTASARRRGIELLERVGIPGAAGRFDLYPHEFSGGMRQRVMIAMSLLCEPDLLIADEPTTALDVTIQAQILELLAELKRDFNTAIVMITHDLGVVAGLCERVLVMYAGHVVEQGTVGEIFYQPQHPYTLGLLQSMPRIDQNPTVELPVIPGQPPDLQALPPGCPYQDRCPLVFETCRSVFPYPRSIGAGREKACHLGALR